MTQSTRRIVTGHDQTGKAVILIDGAALNVKVRQAAGGIVSTLLWVTDESPADVSGNADRADRDIGVAPPAMGSVFRMVDFPPVTDSGAIDHAAVLREMGLDGNAARGGARNPFMHRTRSVDYAVVLHGKIDLMLDDVEIRLEAGDVLVQQATKHAWVNRGTETCRVAFVLIDASAPGFN